MLLRRRSTQIQTSTGRNWMRSTIFHANLRLIFSPWTIQISSSPVPSKRLLEGEISSLPFYSYIFCMIMSWQGPNFVAFFFSMISARTLLANTRVTLPLLFLGSTELYMELIRSTPSSTLYLLVLIWAFTSLTARRNEGWNLSILRSMNCSTVPLKTRNTCEFLTF